MPQSNFGKNETQLAEPQMSQLKPKRRLGFFRSPRNHNIERLLNRFKTIFFPGLHASVKLREFEDSGGVCLVREVKGFDERSDHFYRHVQFLGRLRHRHLLSLREVDVDHCLLLIFDNIENGSLKDHLNDPLKTPLDWRTRLQIANGVVAALEYLFLFSEPPVCHVSITSSNIMLDENFTAKLSDFGLLPSGGNSDTMPYSEDCLKQKSCRIIFQLGVLILELVTGQSSEMEGSDLIEWIQESRFYNSIDKMIDPDLGNNYDCTELKSLLAVAKLCIKSWDEPSFTIPQLFRHLQRKIHITHQ
ncbi:receptor-like protein [Vigna angularis]|uniref:Receptor-like protein n=1 Tax=Phaseolus angularis TaxID=3914 RepID=A0A8T0JH11_PHAAN|nr:receptor-like protein [Vigna angularis]